MTQPVLSESRRVPRPFVNPRSVLWHRMSDQVATDECATEGLAMKYQGKIDLEPVTRHGGGELVNKHNTGGCSTYVS